MSNILTNNYKADRIRSIVNQLGSNGTYVGVGQHLTDGTDSVAATATNSDIEEQQVYTNLIAGSRLFAADVVPMIDRQTWSTGTVYEQYSRASRTKCFVTVEQGTTKYVYKCLSNNEGVQSTEVPSGTATQPFETSDGYVWSYMFVISEAVFDRFATDTFVPFIEDPAVTQAAVGGTIDSISITDPGVGYTNQLQGTFRVEDLTTGNSLTYKLSSDASSTDDFYNGCMIEVISPASPAFGQMIRVIDYNGTTKVATLEEEFDSIPEIGDVYQVSPGLSFVTNSVPSVEAKARAVIVNGVITSVIFGNRGAGYRTTSATIDTDPSVGATSAIVEPNVSPASGHGSDIISEAYRSGFCSQKQINVDDLGMEQTNEIRAVSLISSPTLNNVDITLSSGNPERFDVGETVKQLNFKGDLTGNTIFTSPSTLTANTEQLDAGDVILITAGTQTLLVDVVSISNTTTAVASASFSGSFEGIGSHVDLIAEATVRSLSGSIVTVDNATPDLNASDLIYGVTSRSSDTPSAIDIDGRSNLALFNQTTRLTGSLISGTLQENETIVGADGTSAAIFSVNSTEDLVSVTNIVGQLSAQQYTGQSSGAVFDVTSIVQGDSGLDSGEILFVNNITPISITSNKKISTKIVIEF